MSGLVLSLFPGIGLLDMAFEEEGFCVVRGPDLLWGGDIRKFHPPTGKFDGVIGGPPCQAFSVLRALNADAGVHGDLIPEFERCVLEARPEWFLMENVKDATLPSVRGYDTDSVLLNNRWFGADQNRLRRFTFGGQQGRGWVLRASIRCEALMSGRFEPAALAGHGLAISQRERGIAERTPEDLARLQGLPESFASSLPFTTHGKKRVIGNGVPLPMGRAIARAVKAAIQEQAA